MTFLFWSIVALHAPLSAIERISYVYTYSPSFLDFLPIEVTTEHRVEFSVLSSRFSLDFDFIHSISSAYIQFIPSHPELKWL